MEQEQVLASMVRQWVDDETPGDEFLADRVVASALAVYVDGGSVAQACEEARTFASSWLHHPSHWKPRREMLRAS